MKRLTMRNRDGRAFARGECDGEAMPAVRVLPELLERLAAYEDTGLTPEEIAALIKPTQTQKFIDDMVQTIAETMHRMVDTLVAIIHLLHTREE